MVDADGPSRRNRYILWIARTRCEASEGVVATLWSRGGNMGTQRHYACQPSCSRKKVYF